MPANPYLEDAPKTAVNPYLESTNPYMEGAFVAQMAAATRHTVGVVGRAIAATDLALANKPIGDSDSYETQLSDNPLQTEQGIADNPDTDESKLLVAKKQIQEGLRESALQTRRGNLQGFGEGVSRAVNVFGAINWVGKILGGFTEDLMQGRVLPTPERGAIPNLSKTGEAFWDVLDNTQPERKLSPVEEGIIEGAKGLPPIVAAGALVSAGVPPSAAFALTMGGTTLEETQDPVQAYKAAAIGAVLPSVGKASKQLGARIMAGAVKNGVIGAENVTAQRAVEAGAELIGIVAFNETMHLPDYASMTPEERSVALQKSLASNLAFLPMIVPTVFGKGRTATQERLAEVAPLTAEAVAKVSPVGESSHALETAEKSTYPLPPTPLTTEAVAKVVEKEPVPPPAPTPTEAVGESGTPPVTAGEPPAKAIVPPEAPVSKPEGERTLTTENPFDTSVTSARLTELDKSKPRPTDKLYGKSGGTPELRAENDAKLRKWTNERAKAVREHRAMVEKSNEWIRQQPPSVPEHLRPSKSTQDILDSQPATVPPEGGLKTAVKPTPEGGAIFGIGGRRPAPPRPVGNTPRGDANWLRIPSAIRRVGRGLFTEGARAVLGRTRNQVGQELSRATRRHVDIEQELFGMHEAGLRTAVRAIPRQRLDAAMTEASQYFREVENGRPAPALSAEAQSLVDAWFAIGRSTGDIARANNVMVFDPALGAHRPMGNVANYVPRMFTAEVEAVLRDPQTDPVLFNRLAQEIATARGVTLEEGAAELRGVAGRFQANDYMANLELARGAQMPELFYEYNLRNLAARYLPSFSERMAQIIAYGQRLGPRDAPQRQNLWDVARLESEDAHTQQWLNTTEDQATGFKPKSELEKNARRMQALASATLLSDPTTTVVRNLLSGVAATTEAYGVGRSVRQFTNAMRMAARLGARELGAVRDDLAAFLNSDQLGDSALDNAIRGTSRVALNVSGFTGSENFVRTHNGLVASQFARDAAAALAANPASKFSREALAQFQRWGIDPEAIITEGGNWRTGPETRRYIRTAIREMQGGYRFDQVPLWANSTAGRFFYQYGRWGVQRAQNIFQNIIRPFIGEDVTFRGRQMTSRNTLPLIRTAALMIGLGETFSAISSGLFGKDRRDSSLSEISEAWSEDELKAVGLLGERMVNDIIMAGTLGIIGQPVDFVKSAKDQSRFKNPLDPPSAAGIKTLVELAQRAVDQDGTLTKKDLLDAASRITRGPKNVSDVVRHHLGESLYEGQNDQRTLRNAAMRWAKETKQDVPIKAVTEIRKSPTAPAYEAVNDALLSGNAEAAKKAADKFIASQPDQDKARMALKSSVNSRAPFRAGNLTSEAHKNEFMEWAEKSLSTTDVEQIKRVQERYLKTAGDAGLN